MNSSRLRVLIAHYAEGSPLDDGYRPKRYGQLAEELVRRGHTVTRLVPRHPHLLDVPRGPDGSTVEGDIVHLDTPAYVRSRSLARIRFLIRYAIEVRRHVRRHDHDVVLAGFPPPFAPTRRRGGAPAVVRDVRDIWPEAQIGTTTGVRRRVMLALRPMVHWQARRNFRRATFVTAVSEEYASWASRTVGGVAADRSIAIPIGAVRPASLEPVAAGDRAGAIFLGTLTPHFDFPALAAAWQLVVARCADWQHPPRLTIVGDGDTEPLVRSLFGSLPGVHLLGRRPGPEAAQLLEGSQVGLAPYARTSAMTSTNKIAEYLAAGLPIVSTKPGALAAELAAAGVLDLVDPADVDGYATAIVRRLSAPPAEAVASASGTYDRLLAAEAVAGRFADVIEQAARLHRSEPG